FHLFFMFMVSLGQILNYIILMRGATIKKLKVVWHAYSLMIQLLVKEFYVGALNTSKDILGGRVIEIRLLGVRPVRYNNYNKIGVRGVRYVSGVAESGRFYRLRKFILTKI
ncbi:hypothetical protein ACJX0J_016649, partial [Zea mays]